MLPVRQKISEGGVTDIEYNSDGSLIAASVAEGNVLILKTENLSLVGQFLKVGFVNKLCWSPNDPFIIAACRDGSVFSLNTQNFQKELLYKSEFSAFCVASSQHILAVCGFTNGDICILRKGSDPRSFMAHNAPITSVCITEDEKFILSTGTEGILRTWQAEAQPFSSTGNLCVNSVSVSHESIVYAQLCNPLPIICVESLNRAFQFVRFDKGQEGEQMESRLCGVNTQMMPSQFAFMAGNGCDKYRFICYPDGEGHCCLIDTALKKFMYRVRVSNLPCHAIACHPITQRIAFGGGPGDGNLTLFTLDTTNRPNKATEDQNVTSLEDEFKEKKKKYKKK